ncbi:origin recognition complex subunit 4 C-terminus-domain-containing protein [Rhodocollybia butyracea]|uniref:Origin recognition complex subunit 4 C-terminus-domain-containing protein n=1 Tax=Rhodocollybia butyracea TaxID=206335 RepID=A0A9P5Q744_9AGAR|nr:origin recognition complex subunit 4 C-terminus-domain-containing protein [Rhodocollybia butyracea]
MNEIPATPSRKPRKKAEPKPIFPSAKTVQFEEAVSEPQPSPSKSARTYGRQTRATRSSPQKNTQLKTPSITPPPVPPQHSPSRKAAKVNLAEHLTALKSAILHNLQHPSVNAPEDTEDFTTNDTAIESLSNLLQGTVDRGEGNSCLLLGPRGSGKTQAIESCIAKLSEAPIVVRLSGWVQTNDRLAMQEISRQLSAQVSPTLLPEDVRGTASNDLEEDDENPFLDNPTQAIELSVPTAHMHTLIACIPTLGRPTIVILDAFDLFTDHPRQSLLYSLLDTVQSARTAGGHKGLAVVGVSTRMDSIVLMEKRVKSRFSGRMIRTSASKETVRCKNILKALLTPSIIEAGVDEEFIQNWNAGVDDFLADVKTTRILAEVCSITGDIRTLSRLLISPVLNISPASPWLTVDQLELSVETQRIRPEFPYLHTLTYPSLCLLLAFYQAEHDGYDSLTFEMLYDYVRTAIRVTHTAPVQVNGGSIGMVRCSRPVLWAASAFEQLISAQIFIPTAASSINIGKNFLKYRCSVNREDVKKSVDNNGHSSLKQFLKRAGG